MSGKISKQTGGGEPAAPTIPEPLPEPEPEPRPVPVGHRRYRVAGGVRVIALEFRRYPVIDGFVDLPSGSKIERDMLECGIIGG